MPEAKTNRRKSILKRLSLKPWLGRLRRKSAETGLRSPTGVADIFQEHVDDAPFKEKPSTIVQDINVEIPSSGEENKENLQVAAKVPANHDVVDEKRGTILRDFSSSNVVGRDHADAFSGTVFLPSFHRVSPLSWGSTGNSIFGQQSSSANITSSTEDQVSASSTYFTPVNKDDNEVNNDEVEEDNEKESDEAKEWANGRCMVEESDTTDAVVGDQESAQDPAQVSSLGPQIGTRMNNGQPEVKGNAGMTRSGETDEDEVGMPSTGDLDVEEYLDQGSDEDKATPRKTKAPFKEDSHVDNDAQLTDDFDIQTVGSFETAIQSERETKAIVQKVLDTSLDTVPQPSEPDDNLCVTAKGTGESRQTEQGGVDDEDQHKCTSGITETKAGTSPGQDDNDAPENPNDGNETEAEKDQETPQDDDVHENPGMETNRNKTEEDKDESTLADQADESMNPEELFKKGETVLVDIVKGKYKSSKQAKIIDIRKRIKLLISGEEHWLNRSSLEFNGKTFPDHVDQGAQQKPNKTAPNPPESCTFQIQIYERVNIVKGKYEGQSGTVMEIKTRIKVLLDGTGENPWLAKTSLDGLGVQADPIPTQSQANGTSSEKPSGTKRETSTGRTSGTSRARSKTTNPAASALINEDWRIANSEKGGDSFGAWRVFKLKLKSNPEEANLLSHWLQGRMLICEIPLDKEELPVLTESPPKIVEKDGSKFELIVSKIQSDGDRVAPAGAPALQCIHLYYCQVEGPGLQPIALQEELERIADFGGLNPAKVCPRLELLVSPAYKCTAKRQDGKTHSIFVLKQSTFGEIEENGNEGCGFISRDLLEEFLGNGVAAKRTYAIQVRGFSALGMFKGMLVTKLMTPGEPAIQIPSSMIVVGPSRSSDPEEKALLIINRNGVHPNNTNRQLGKVLQGDGACKTFKDQQGKKKISEMFHRLWTGLGVPKETLLEYTKRCRKVEEQNHGFVVGLADPTSELPHGTVFIPGLDHTGEIFVTRSPCIETSDGRLVPVVTSKPDQMSAENWEMLQELPFGAIIFSNPKPGMTPMPVLIADGDLDGDLYFICWHKPIIEQVTVKPMVDVPYNDSKKAFPYQRDWLSSAQERMVDAEASLKVAQVIGKLYNKAIKIAQEAKESSNFLEDKDYRAYAKAYKESLKIGKHGGKVPLPARLHDQLPSKFRDILADTEG
ncbi:autoimmune regulator [Seminavis robusta]|uniref:RNA-dependent RNA polymerase n=1 Tax=Seminavis robusta TaxID=568900 RepID=A0A9N8DG00_9STRA|nr:autoimmune regulator [Seminavis robusta]|eukprot:Sro70_g038940.1 autoimmune regulator (1183) ;mRNA; f:67741-71289